MTLYQNKNNKNQNKTKKRKKQINPNYFINTKLKINMTNLFKKTTFSYFSQNKITNYYLNIKIKQHSYTNFQNPLKITNSSIKINFSFDYL